MTVNLFIENPDISYADLEREGWSQALIDDYQAFKRLSVPQKGSESDPNGVYRANLNGMYVDTVTPSLWYNPTNGADTGWIQLA